MRPPEQVAPRPLSRNRDYNILWSGQLLSEFAMEVAMVAFPLLILAHSGSALQMGLSASVMAAAGMVAVVPAGVVADRWDRRRVMVVCQGARAAALLSLVLALALGRYTFAHVLVVMVLEGVLSSVFDPAEHAALPQVVPESQLSRAISRNMARPFVATLLGPALAGVLFALDPADPFLAGAVTLAAAAVALYFLRLPRAAPDADPADATSACQDLAEGLRWVLRNVVIRTTLLWMMGTNLVFSALLIVILARSSEDRIGAGEIGVMMGCLGLGGLLGATLAGRMHDAFRAPVIILGFSWTAAAATGAMVLVPSGVPLGVLLGVAAFLAPVANTTVMTYQLTVTPDRLRGRLSGFVGLCSGGAGALGPTVGGLLMTGTGGGPAAVAICAGCLVLVAAATTASPTLRRFPAPESP